MQIQSTAVPLDVSKEYPWFSQNNLTHFFDASLDPAPVSNTLSLVANVKLSRNFKNFVGTALSLVEVKELDADTLKRIDNLEIEIQNLGEQIAQLETKRLARATFLITDRGED